MQVIRVEPTEVARCGTFTITFEGFPSGLAFEAGIVGAGYIHDIIDYRSFTIHVGDDVPLGPNTVYVKVEGYTEALFPIEVYKEGIEVEPSVSQIVLSNYRLDIPAFGGTNEVSRSIKVAFDPDKTGIIKGVVKWRIDLPGIGLAKHDAWLLVDGVEEAHEGWVGIGGERRREVDITTYVLSPRELTFTVRVAGISAASWFTDVSVHLTYSGEAPSFQPGPLPPPRPPMDMGAIMQLTPLIIVMVLIGAIREAIRLE